MAAKKNKFEQWYGALPKKSKKRVNCIGLGVVALIVILIVLIRVDLLPHLDGSLNVVGGKLPFAKDNALIVNLGSKDSPRYFSVGTVTIPEGYYDDESLGFKSDKLTTDFTLRMKDTGDTPWFNYVAITACSESQAQRLEAARSLTAVADEEENVTYGEQFNDKSKEKGLELAGYIYGGDTKDEYSGRYSRYALAYIPTSHEDCCVMIQVIASRERRMTLPSDEDLMECLRTLADTITID